MTTPLALSLTTLLLATSLSAHAADTAFTQIQSAYWKADMSELATLCDRLDQAADNTATTRYSAALCDYRLASAGYQDPKRYSVQIDQALQRSALRLEKLSTENLSSDNAPYRAEALNLLSGVYGMQAGQNPALGQILGPKAGAALAEAEKLSPDNPRILMNKAFAKMAVPKEYGGDPQAALQLMEQAIAKFPAKADPENWGVEDAYAWRGYMLQQSDKAGAKASVDKALSIAPDFAWAKALQAKLK